MSGLNIDVNIDKHLNATLVVECPECGHEITHHLKTLTPDSILPCTCGTRIGLSDQHLRRAQSLHTQSIAR
ncbi:hypothetical protein [Chitinilyticum piscinae]|uniref:Uncharacterized protein n=1 Tax=Chitinilyticum piscinae TaxID=2866724 RepID=A0A8J7FN90_9NEIS|nr:hypothetical protein [Chitinilyticum piscinae]MBE9609796.1 hypothetical protein [Chitinilyticum piscinae]